MDQATPNEPQERATDLPPNASHFRIRHLTGRKGPPALVLDGDEPMTLPLDATMEDMKAVLAPGRYRLEVCDEAGKPLGVSVSADLRDEEDEEEEAPAPPALPPAPLAPVPSVAPVDPTAPTTALLLRDALATLRSSNETLTETIGSIARAMAAAFGPVNPAKEPVEAPPVQVVSEPTSPPPTQPSSFDTVARLIEQFGPMIMAALMKANASATPPASAAPASTGATS